MDVENVTRHAPLDVAARWFATHAVRAAIGQLLTYRHFLYRQDDRPRMAALFSEPIGRGYEEFLEGLETAAVWWDAGSWLGSRTAVALGADLATLDIDGDGSEDLAVSSPEETRTDLGTDADLGNTILDGRRDSRPRWPRHCTPPSRLRRGRINAYKPSKHI